jgi:hypothetical protein
MAVEGHEDAFPRPGLSARCPFSQGTFARTRGNGRDALIPAVRDAVVEPPESTLSSHSLQAPLWFDRFI